MRYVGQRIGVPGRHRGQTPPASVERWPEPQPAGPPSIAAAASRTRSCSRTAGVSMPIWTTSALSPQSLGSLVVGVREPLSERLAVLRDRCQSASRSASSRAALGVATRST